MRGLKFHSNLIPKVSQRQYILSHRFAILVITRMKILLHLPSFNFSFNLPRWDNLPTALRDISLSLHLVFHLTLFHVFPYTLFPLSLSLSLLLFVDQFSISVSFISLFTSSIFISFDQSLSLSVTLFSHNFDNFPCHTVDYLHLSRSYCISLLSLLLFFLRAQIFKVSFCLL